MTDDKKEFFTGSNGQRYVRFLTDGTVLPVVENEDDRERVLAEQDLASVGR